VPFLFVPARAQRLELAVPIALAAALVAGLLANRFRRTETERLAERRTLAEEAQQSEQRFRVLVEAVPVVTWMYETGDRSTTRFISPQVETMLGYSPEEWQAEPDLFSRLLHAEDRDRALAEIERGTVSGTAFQAEYRLLARSGRVVWIREHGATLRGPDGEPAYGRSFLADITEEKRSHEEREGLLVRERAAVQVGTERQHRLDLLREIGDLTLSSLDYMSATQRVARLLTQGFADWCVIDTSDEGDELKRVAVSRAEPPGHDADAEPDHRTDATVRAVVERGLPQLIPRPGQGSRGREAAEFLRGLSARSVICVPLRARERGLGALTVARTRIAPTYGADELAFVEDVAGRVAIAVDRTRLHQEVEERADAAGVIAHVGDGVVLVDRNGIVRLWNPAAERITMLSASEVIGRSALETIPGWQSVAETVPIAPSPDPAHHEVIVPIETADGERWIGISGVRFFEGAVYAFRDLTDVHRLEELKADFIATASHELRTPLAAIYGAAQTLLRHDFALDEGGRDRFVSLIAEESERLSRIVNEILLANQLDAGRVELQPEPFDAIELMDRVVEATRAYAPPGITVERTAPEEHVRVAADRDKVRQVLANLAENAIKYSPDGGRIDVGVETGEEALFYVRDEGLGIPNGERGRVFEKFYRVDPHMTRGIGGTGLGLYICSELVSRMGGRIWVEANDAKGSTFLFALPLAESLPFQRLAAETAEPELPRQ
jgi:two-component system phosphate regulon sensor histidine kinase PhoR